ncbi:MAG: MFS transporter, partial [Litoreibacter sp.]|nr:MFS transporter [Litoreibacter sp.]
LSQQAQAKLAAEGIKARIIDLRWLAPLPLDAVLEQVSDCDHVLIVDECRRTGSQSEGLLAGLFEAGRTALSRITAEDCFIATGPAYAAPLPSVDAIVKRARILCKKTP